MRNILLASAAAVLLASPAAARDGSAYLGLEGGVLFPRNLDHDVTASVQRAAPIFLPSGVDMNLKRGYDVDVIFGYDFGVVRAEAEVGLKRASVKNIDLALAPLNPAFVGVVDSSGNVRTTSVMGNLLLDLGGDDVTFYAGGGFGRAWVSMNNIDVGASGLTVDEKDNAWAWQLIAGLRTGVSDNVDLGLKYRYFQTANLSFTDVTGTAPAIQLDTDAKFRSHSLLASLIFNFGGREAAPPPPPPAPPPAPPPPPPATQTCPDGSVILATDACPVPPPPPPPPPPAPERG